jgi:hypothetical protein
VAGLYRAIETETPAPSGRSAAMRIVCSRNPEIRTGDAPEATTLLL